MSLLLISNCSTRTQPQAFCVDWCSPARVLKKRSDYLQNYLNTVEIYAPGTVERWVAEGEYEAVKAIVGRGQNPEHFSREILLAGEKAAIDAARREADANGGGLSP